MHVALSNNALSKVRCFTDYNSLCICAVRLMIEIHTVAGCISTLDFHLKNKKNVYFLPDTATYVKYLTLIILVVDDTWHTLDTKFMVWCHIKIVNTATINLSLARVQQLIGGSSFSPAKFCSTNNWRDIPEIC